MRAGVGPLQKIGRCNCSWRLQAGCSGVGANRASFIYGWLQLVTGHSLNQATQNGHPELPGCGCNMRRPGAPGSRRRKTVVCPTARYVTVRQLWYLRRTKGPYSCAVGTDSLGAVRADLVAGTSDTHQRAHSAWHWGIIPSALCCVAEYPSHEGDGVFIDWPPIH